MAKNTSHIGYYISLLAILLFGLALASLTTDKKLQMSIATLMTLFYVVWGVLHHLINHDLSLKIVVEYVLIGSLGLMTVFFLLKGGLGI